VTSVRQSYDEELVESVVVLCAARGQAGVGPAQVRRYEAARDRCYDVPDPDARNAAFHRCHLTCFREWGHEAALQRVVQEFPLLDALDLLAWRRATTAKDEGAELFVREDGRRHGVVALRAERLADSVRLAPFLRHELAHISDMLDPAFGYSPDLRLTGPVPTPQRLVRERYRLLWALTIDGRLVRAGRADPSVRDRHESAFHRAYGFWPEPKRREVFDRLWFTDAPRHAELLALASDPRDLQHAQQPLPGAPCPLCAFPTFDWAEAADLPNSARVAIARQFPGWQPAHGLCDRCREIYDVATRFEYPPTVVI
jgi:hypothetical protein